MYALLCKPQSMRSGKVENLCRIFIIIILLILKTFQWNAVCVRESMTTSTTLHAISQWLINIREESHDKGDDDQKNKKHYSHKIFMIMLATLLPCLFSAMHTYTPLSVRFKPLVNVNACTDESTSWASKRFQWYFGAGLKNRARDVIKFMPKL